MAKTRKRNTGETPREFAGASQPDTASPPQLEAPNPESSKLESPQPESPMVAPFEGPTSEEAERIGEPESGEAWAPQATGDTTVGTSERDRIAARAYELYLERGGSGGDATEDWLAAEREFINRNSSERGSRE